MSAIDGKPTPRPTPDRAAWLLSPVSSMGRFSIEIGQYEELRAEATALKSAYDELCEIIMSAAPLTWAAGDMEGAYAWDKRAAVAVGVTRK